MNVILVRHTEVAVPSGVCYGATDVSLAEDFPSAAMRIQAQLPPSPWRLMSSPSQRCRKLAALLSHEIVTDSRLMELNFGEWEMRPWEEIPMAELDAWADDFVHRAPPGGETFAALAARAHGCIAEQALQFPRENLVCVTHAGVIRALAALQSGTELRDAFRLHVAYGSLHVLPGYKVAVSAPNLAVMGFNN